MNRTLLTLVLSMVAIIIIGYSLHIYKNVLSSEKEFFINDYYSWDWNNPNIVTLINTINTEPACKNCYYSISCDYTDDAHPYCYESYDVPSLLKNGTNKVDNKSDNIMVHNSY